MPSKKPPCSFLGSWGLWNMIQSRAWFMLDVLVDSADVERLRLKPIWEILRAVATPLWKVGHYKTSR